MSTIYTVFGQNQMYGTKPTKTVRQKFHLFLIIITSKHIFMYFFQTSVEQNTTMSSDYCQSFRLVEGEPCLEAVITLILFGLLLILVLATCYCVLNHYVSKCTNKKSNYIFWKNNFYVIFSKSTYRRFNWCIVPNI